MKILIISDGKAGHLNQSIAFAKLKNIAYDIIEIKPNKFLKILSYIFDFLRLHVNLYGLHVKTSYKAVISTGSSTYYANKYLAKKLNIKSIAIMLPKGFRYSDFDYILALNHDNPPQCENIIQIPLNLSTNEPKGYIKANNIQKSIGIIIGGNNSIFIMEKEDIKDILDKVFANFPNHLKYLTTSRRTPKEIDALLKNYTFDYELIYSKNSSINPIADFIDVCDELFITIDSTSMLSEARANSDAKIHIIKLESNKENTKFHKLAQNIEKMKEKFDYMPYLNKVKI